MDGYARAKRLGLRWLEHLTLQCFWEGPLSAAGHDREHHQAQLVDEVVVDQPLHQGGAPGDKDGPAVPLLQLADLLREVALNERRVVPGERIFERSMRRRAWAWSRSCQRTHLAAWARRRRRIR